MVSMKALGVGAAATTVVGGINYGAWKADQALHDKHGQSPGLGLMAFLPSMAIGTVGATGGLLGKAAGSAGVALLLPAGLGMVAGAMGGGALAIKT